jgi:hypothetical protein
MKTPTPPKQTLNYGTVELTTPITASFQATALLV